MEDENGRREKSRTTGTQDEKSRTQGSDQGISQGHVLYGVCGSGPKPDQGKIHDRRRGRGEDAGQGRSCTIDASLHARSGILLPRSLARPANSAPGHEQDGPFRLACGRDPAPWLLFQPESEHQTVDHAGPGSGRHQDHRLHPGHQGGHHGIQGRRSRNPARQDTGHAHEQHPAGDDPENLLHVHPARIPGTAGKAETMTVEDVITQYQTDIIVADKVRTQDKGLSQPIRVRLHTIIKAHSDITAIT